MQTQPHIILIMTDQQRYDTIAALGFDYMETPHLDRLVKEGISFNRCYVTGPTCVPSRASFFKGLYPHSTGIYKNQDLWQHSWVEDLSRAGYHCVNVGKMHTTPFETPLGFDERFVVENKDRYLEGRYFLDRWDMALQARKQIKPGRELYRKKTDYQKVLGAFAWEIDEDLHPDFFTGDMALNWINYNPKSEKPLFLQIGFPGPHPPYDAIDRYGQSYLGKDLPEVDMPQREWLNQPEVLRKINEENSSVDHDSVSWRENPSPEDIKKMRAQYFGNVTMIDEKIGQILKALDKKGYLEDSVVIFTSDHGDCLGDHGYSQKWSMFEQIVRVPMILWSPRVLKGRGGRQIDALCQHFDMAHTLLELAGVDIPPYFESRSLLPFLEGKEDRGREYIFCEQGEDSRLRYGGCRQITMVRNHEWKLVHYLGTSEGELYHLTKDPGEHRNLWNQPDYKEIKADLKDRLLEWSMESSLKTESFKNPVR